MRSGDGEGDSEDEFFDCKEVPEDLRSLTKWNSMELVPDQENDYSGKRLIYPLSLLSLFLINRTLVHLNIMPLKTETR